jgi:ribosomal protein S18 acetylase RimI-like enzyme
MISNKVSIGKYIDNLKFSFKNEYLIFKNISNSQATHSISQSREVQSLLIQQGFQDQNCVVINQGVLYNSQVNDVTFGLFKEDNTQLGESYCRGDKYQGDAWYLDSIEIFPGFRGSGYGTQLLEKTCEALWLRTKAHIVLERPGNTISTNGFNRKCWYEKHGFEAHPDPNKTWMWRKPPI